MSTGVYKRTKYHLELLDKARAAAIGIPHPNKSKQMFGEGNHFYGKKHSEESKAKMSEKLKGRTVWNKGLTKETNEGVMQAAKAKTGKKCSEETIEKMSKARKGKSLNEFGHKINCKCSVCRATRGEFRGENNPMYGVCGRDAPNFRGGASYEPYPPEFNVGLCRKIRERDNHTCQLCEKTEKEEKAELARVLSVHHIDYDKQNCVESNLITLCGKCNSKVNYNREKWIIYFSKLMSNKSSSTTFL